MNARKFWMAAVVCLALGVPALADGFGFGFSYSRGPRYYAPAYVYRSSPVVVYEAPVVYDAPVVYSAPPAVYPYYPPVVYSYPPAYSYRSYYPAYRVYRPSYRVGGHFYYRGGGYGPRPVHYR
jgi:hypothetical protein